MNIHQRSFVGNRRLVSDGIAALPAVIIFGGIIAEIAIAAAFLAFALNNTSLGIRLSAEAFSAARSGVEDAVLLIVRNKNYENQSGYSINVGRATATVVVTKDSPTVGKTTIESIGTSFRRKRKVSAIVSIDPVTAVVKIISFTEVPL